MCGIYGYISSRPSRIDIHHALNKLKHRGPDSNGRWVSKDGRVTFGHVRLSIQDLSSLGHQPMVDDNGRFAVVFNGEIYNFKLIRTELSNLGHHFESRSDTEVVLRAYREWGPKCLDHFNGMFSLAILDQGVHFAQPTVFLARDRAGEKPLYYHHSEKCIEFASELKGVKHKGEVDICSLNHYLALGYVPADKCLFDGVQKLPPGHCAEYNILTSELSVRAYWSLPQYSPKSFVDSRKLVSEVGRLIEDSVAMRLIADVPVGVLLSGGLDSSLIAAAASRVSSQRINTFTIGFPGSSLDESSHAKKVADYLGTNHHVLEMDDRGLNSLDQFSKFIDEPIADSSIIPSFMVFQLARKEVKVALGGDGGDELFGGYSIYLKTLKDYERFGYIPKNLLAIIASLGSKLPVGLKGRNFLISQRNGPLEQIVWNTPYFDLSLRKRILSSDIWKELGSRTLQPEHFLRELFNSGQTNLDRMARTHFGSILPDDFLFKLDRASMANSIEIRTPMLDHNLIEFCFSQIPDDLKVKSDQTRRLQKMIGKEWLPPDLDLNRKQGFSIPLHKWLSLAGESTLMDRMSFLPNIICRKEVHSLVKGLLKGRSNGGRIFALIMLSISIENSKL